MLLCLSKIGHNVLALGEEAVPIAIEIEALNCLPVRNEVKAGLPALNLIRSTKLHLTTEPPISCGAIMGWAFLFSRQPLFFHASKFLNHFLAESLRCGQPGQQHGRFLPSIISSLSR